MSWLGFNIQVANNRGREGLYSAALVLCVDRTKQSLLRKAPHRGRYVLGAQY